MGAAMRYPPQGLIRLNRSNPLTRGLVAAYVPRSGPRDATGTLATLVDVVPVASPLGYVTPPLNTGPYPVVGTFPFTRTDPISAFVLGRLAVSNDANGAPVVSVGQTGGSNGWKFGPVGSGGNLILTFINVADYSTSVQFPAIGSVAFSATPGANARIFSNGVFRQQLGVGTPNNTLPTARMAIGQRGDANADSTSAAQVALALYWNRALSDAEQASLAANPWQIFDTGSRSSAYQSAIATPGTTTGNATATITGASASPAAGTITASGGAAATLPGLASSAQAGTIAASGGAGASLIGATMSAAAGAIVASGGAGAALPGAASTAQAGTITASGGAGATVPGAQGGIAAGSIAASGAANASVSSAGATFQAGTISATAGGSANVALVGVAMSSAAGTVTASGGASATIPGATSSAQAGQVTGSGGAQIGIVGAAVMLQAGLMSAAAVSGDVVARLPGAGMVASAGVIVAVGTRSGIDVNVTEDMICAVVRGYIKSIAPALRVIRTPVNKASMPTGAYVSFTPGVRRPLSTNVTDTASNERIIGRSEQMGFQIDCYGDGSADLAETLNTLFRDGYAVESFARAEFEIVPLFANDIMQAPFVNDSEQYEERYTFQIELQVKSSITVPQDSCNILSVDLISVDATYPH